MMNRKLLLVAIRLFLIPITITTHYSCNAFLLPAAPGGQQSVYYYYTAPSSSSVTRGAADFSALQQQQQQYNNRNNYYIQTKHNKLLLTRHHSKSNNNNNDPNDNDTVEESSNNKKLLVQTIDTILQLLSFGIQILGVFFSLGLVLNLCGYGYQVSMDRGLEIDTLDVFRQKIQWRREIQGTSSTSRLVDAPSISLPR